MMKKRLLCALLLLALALSLLPTVALADDANTAGTAEELQSLLGQRKTPIKLTDNINLKGQPLTISGSNITIDMAGYTIFGGELIVEVSETLPLNLTGEGQKARQVAHGRRGLWAVENQPTHVAETA